MERRGRNTKRGSESTVKGSGERKIGSGHMEEGSENTRRKRIQRDRENKYIKERRQKVHNGNSNTN